MWYVGDRCCMCGDRSGCGDRCGVCVDRCDMWEIGMSFVWGRCGMWEIGMWCVEIDVVRMG